MLSDVGILFSMCRDAFSEELANWSEKPIPDNWRESFELDGLSIPKNGDPDNEWDISYFAKPASHYFTAVIRSGHVDHVEVDG